MLTVVQEKTIQPFCGELETQCVVLTADKRRVPGPAVPRKAVHQLLAARSLETGRTGTAESEGHLSVLSSEQCGKSCSPGEILVMKSTGNDEQLNSQDVSPSLVTRAAVEAESDEAHVGVFPHKWLPRAAHAVRLRHCANANQRRLQTRWILFSFLHCCFQQLFVCPCFSFAIRNPFLILQSLLTKIFCRAQPRRTGQKRILATFWPNGFKKGNHTKFA